MTLEELWVHAATQKKGTLEQFRARLKGIPRRYRDFLLSELLRVKDAE